MSRGVRGRTKLANGPEISKCNQTEEGTLLQLHLRHLRLCPASANATFRITTHSLIIQVQLGVRDVPWAKTERRPEAASHAAASSRAGLRKGKHAPSSSTKDDLERKEEERYLLLSVPVLHYFCGGLAWPFEIKNLGRAREQ